MKDRLLKAAKPEIRIIEKKGFLFKKQIEEILLDEKGFRVFEEGLKETAEELYKLRGISLYVYDQKSATAILEKLEKVNLRKEDIHQYCQENLPEDVEEGTKSIQKAHEYFKAWLEKINENENGLLSIG